MRRTPQLTHRKWRLLPNNNWVETSLFPSSVILYFSKILYFLKTLTETFKTYFNTTSLQNKILKMESLLTVSSTTYSLLGILFTVITAILIDLWWRNRCEKSCEKSIVIDDGLIEPPGPRSWPIIGSLHLLGGYEVPYQAFDSLAKHYGKIFKMDLGSISCVVVNGLENIREVLMSKSTHFDGRPNFRRYQQLFSGNKENCK